MTDESRRARAVRGADLLHLKLPGWWREDFPRPINLDTLDLGSDCGCILGQTWDVPGDGDDAFCLHADKILGFDHDLADEVYYGFNLYDGSRAGFDALTAEWKRIIISLRAEAAREVAGR